MMPYFGVMDEGVVETTGVIDVADTVVKNGMGPNCDMTGDKIGEVTVVGGGAEAEATIRDGDKVKVVRGIPGLRWLKGSPVAFIATGVEMVRKLEKMAEVGAPLSKFGVLVAQLSSIVASARQQPPDPLLCFDLLSDLVSIIEDEPKESILLWQRKCEDALQSLILFGARRPVRRLASIAMVRIIEKGDNISIYSRASGFQGWLSDTRKNDPLSYIGKSQELVFPWQEFQEAKIGWSIVKEEQKSEKMRDAEAFVSKLDEFCRLLARHKVDKQPYETWQAKSIGKT
ncbi:hypothetical protein KI387_006406 [Taxus chinensis]|uniref:Uncharacterized protein n=1 Tax=Taxus chinensis TaxID=29808 RepID=A0AA38GQ04_TAXCH|nr:hypothetical protein KI387_006406 [Taxus chinensis]